MSIIPLLGEFSRASYKVQRESSLHRPRHLVSWYAALLGVAALLLCSILVLNGASWGAPLWAVIVLAGAALIAERQSVRLGPNSEISVAALPLLFAAVVYGPLVAMAVGVFGLIADARHPYTRWVIWTCSRALGAGLAGLAASAIGTGKIEVLLAASATAVLVDTCVDTFLGTITLAVRGKQWKEFLVSIRPMLLVTVPLHAPVVALLAYGYSQVSAWSALLFFVPTYAAQSLYRLYREEREASLGLKEANRKLEEASLSFAAALVAALDARDRYTAGHSAAVAIYARDIAARMELPDDQQELAHLSGLLHDIGKVGLPPGILEKAGPLTLQERRAMEQHSETGETILGKVSGYSEIARIVRHHHERMDGTGYPDGISGEEIPLIARIICVADAYNAMTSGRPYREAMTTQVARLRIAQATGAQFDTAVVAAFEVVLASESEQYRLGLRADFALEARQHRELGLQETSAAAHAAA